MVTFEVKIERWSPARQCLIRRFEYVEAINEDEARVAIGEICGKDVRIISVESLEDL